MAANLREQISAALTAGRPSGAVTDRLLSESYAYALRLDAERLALERRITALAARAHEEGAAQELRAAWLRHRTINAELEELRALLRRLREAASPAEVARDD